MSDTNEPNTASGKLAPRVERERIETDGRDYVELDWSGQRLYLPEYTTRFREIERKMIEAIEGLGFKECLFPKLVTADQFDELRNALPRFEHEGVEEAVHATCADIDGFPRDFVHTHWQCEPFYYYLEQETPTESVLFYDRSGWSHRLEQSIDDDRLFEFHRIESVWFAPEAEAARIQQRILDVLTEAISELGFTAEIVRKYQEEEMTGEETVYDIEVQSEAFGPVEVTGTHHHGRLFLDAVDADVDERFHTGCCGIGTSRLANLIHAAD